MIELAHELMPLMPFALEMAWSMGGDICLMIRCLLDWLRVR